MDLSQRTVERPYPKRWERRIANLERITVKHSVPAFADSPRRFGVGGPNGRSDWKPDGNCGPTTGVSTNPNCYRSGQSLCDFGRVGGALLGQAANAAFGPVVIVPTNTQYFEPIAAECIVTVNANPDANARVRFTAFVIAATPQEAIDNRAPTVATTAFLWSDHYLPSDYGPRPVSWGIFSVAALTKDLQIFGFNPNAFAVDIEWAVYGNPLDALPAGRQAGVPAIM